MITGKVTDGEGRPVVQHNVEIYRAEAFDNRAMPQQPQSQPQQQRQPMFPARSVQTDDRGIYRVYGLAPGRYKVSAGRNENGVTTFSISPLTYTQVFHPDAKEPAKATVIEVTEASEATSVFAVALRRRMTHSFLPVSVFIWFLPSVKERRMCCVTS